MPTSSVGSWRLVGAHWAIAVLTTLGLAAPVSRAADQPSPDVTADHERRIKELEDTIKQLKREQPEPEPVTGGPRLFATYADGFVFGTTDGQFKLILRGYMQGDGYFFINNHTVSSSQFLMRRVRPVLEGTVFRNFDFKVMPDFAGSKATLFDAYLDVNYIPELRLQAGKFKAPLGLERLESARHLLFVERGLTKDLVPVRDIGIQLHGDLFGGALSYATGIFNGAPDYGNPDSDANSDKDFDGRVFAQPWKKTEVAPLKGLGFGIAGSYGHEHGSTSNTDLPAYITSAQVTFFNYVTNSSDPAKTAIALGTHSRISPQGYYFWGPLGLLADYVTSGQGVAGGGKSASLRHNAWQAVGSYVLTGEAATFDGVTPAHPFNPWTGTWGALQVAARYATLDVDQDAFRNGFADPTKSARQAKEWAVGANWYLNSNVKFVLDYSNTDFKGGTAHGDRPTEKVILSRLQIAF